MTSLTHTLSLSLSLHTNYGAVPWNRPRSYPRTMKIRYDGRHFFFWRNDFEVRRTVLCCRHWSLLVWHKRLRSAPATTTVSLEQCFSTGGLRATGATTRTAGCHVILANKNLYYRLIKQGELKFRRTCATHKILQAAYVTSVTWHWRSLRTLSVTVSKVHSQ